MKNKPLLVALALVLALSAALPAALSTNTRARVPVDPPQEAPEPAFDEHYRLVFSAVLEGLYRDGLSNEVVDALTRVEEESGYPELFVWGCPICMPAYNAFRVYRGRPELVGVKVEATTFGAGLAPGLRARCLDPERDVRFGALNGLVKGWVEHRLDEMRLTEAERDRWSVGFEDRRKKGMSLLGSMRREGSYAGMKTCALCDGANDAFLPR